MRAVIRTICLGYLGLAAVMLVLKSFVPLPGIIGYAPFPLALGPAGQPIELVVWHSPEQGAWLTEAVQRFETTQANIGGRPIRVRLTPIESPEMVTRIVQEDWSAAPQPHVIIPASALWVDALQSEWAAQQGGIIVRGGADAPRPLLLTPLVAVAWEDRANLLWPNGAATFWDDLQTALADPNGWAGVAAAQGFAAGSPEARRAESWGSVKFAHSSPLTTHNGMQALLLMSYAFHNKTADLTSADIADPALRAWVQPITAATLDLGADPQALMDDLVRFGPNTYDLVLVDEHLALEQILSAQSRWGQQIRIYYPPATFVSDHPYTLLDAPFTSAAEQAAGAALRSFLLSADSQQRALQRGFRPAEPTVPLSSADPNNPFNLYAPLGARIEYGRQVAVPPPDVTAALQTLWRLELDQYTLLPQEER